MALDARKRQKKVERRKKKERSNRKELTAKTAHSWKARLERATRGPVLHCLTNGSQGMHQLLLSRKTADGMVAYAVFLVDSWCLGVKDAFFGLISAGDYDEKVFSHMSQMEHARSMRPESGRKLVEGAVEYARTIGFAPHADYDKARTLFGNIDAGAATEEFEYGVDGRPRYVSGPYDPLWKSRAIIDTLARTCGEGNFDHVIHVGSHDFTRLLDAGEIDGPFDVDAPDDWESGDDDFDEDEDDCDVVDVSHSDPDELK